MKFCIKSFMLIAAAALAFSSCNKEIEEQQIVVTNGTHTVNFTAVIGEQSKTTMTEGAEAATFAWSRDDEDLFIVYENNVPGETIGVIDGDIMKLAATFADGAEAPFTYTATLNGKVPGKQTLYDGKYDENSDVLIAEPITSQTTSEDFTFKFNRVVALNKMTLKGLGEDEIVTKVIVKADKDIVGSYDIVNDGWTAPADGSPTTEITIDGGEDEGVLIDNGIAVVYFNCIPVSDTQFTIDVTTDKGEYTKTFSKKITLVEGMLNRFNVSVEKKQEPSEYVKVTSELTDWSGEYLLVAPSANMALSGISSTSTKYGMGSAVEIDNDKIKSTDNTNAYKLTIAHASNVSSSSSSQYVIKLGSSYLSWSSGNSLKTDETESENSRWILSFSEGNVLIKNYKDNTRVILWNVSSPRFACYAGQSIGNSYYATALFKLGGGGTPVPPATKYTIIVPDDLTGGIVTSDKYEAEAGETVTITAEPATGYQLSSLTSNVSGEELNGNVLTFAMPEENVTISASFEEIPAVDYSGTYAIFATRNSTKTNWMMTSSISSNRFTATSVQSIPEGSFQTIADNIWTITKSSSGNTYTISCPSGKINWSSGNTITLSESGIGLNITPTSDGKFNISFEASESETRYLALNGTTNNDYFAFYKSGQAQDLYLVPSTVKEATKYELTISSVTGGTITASVDDIPVATGAKIDEGATVSITAVPDTDYTFESWTVTGATVSSTTSATTTFKMNANVTVSAEFVEEEKVPVYASLAELVATNTPTKTGTPVTVTLTDEEIVSLYEYSGSNRGINLSVGEQTIVIYGPTIPSNWVAGGTVSGTLSNCTWKDYNGTWELCPNNWSELTYTAPQVGGDYKTYVYTFTKKDWTATESIDDSGSNTVKWESSADGNQYSATNSPIGVQITAALNGTTVTSNKSFSNIQSIVVNYSSSSKGVGSIDVSVGDVQVGTNAISKSQSKVDLTYTPADTPLNGLVTLTCNCSTSSYAIVSVKIVAE